MTSIHSLASIDPTAKIGKHVEIGPFAVVEGDVVIEDGCSIGSHVVIKTGTRIGLENRICEGAVLGGWPQHLKSGHDCGRLFVGKQNNIREHVTIHRSLNKEQETRIGDDNFIMVGVHIAHDCVVGNSTILANNTLLAGHVLLEDNAYLSAGAMAHQFCRIGRHAMVGGQTRILKDVPPFVTVDGESNRVVGLNFVGLRRHNFTDEQIRELKEVYRLIYRSGLMWDEMLAELKQRFTEGAPAEFYSMLSTTKRGILPERRLPRSTTVDFAKNKATHAPHIRRVG